MFDKKENRFLVTESMCSTVADMLLFNIYEQIKSSEPSTAVLENGMAQEKAKASEPTAAEKRTRKAGA